MHEPFRAVPSQPPPADPGPPAAGASPARTAGPSLEDRLRDAAAESGSVAALVDASGVRATHEDLRRIRDGGRQWLREAGLNRDDRVAVVMSGDWRTAAALLAAMSACAVAALDPGLSARELGVCLAQLRPRAVLADMQTAPRLGALLGAGIRLLIWPGDQLDGTEETGDGERPAPDDLGLLLFTSGSTSAPKLVPLTQRNLAAAADSIAGTLRLGRDDRGLNVMPLCHGHGIFPGILAPLVSGGGTICTRLTNAEQLLAIARSARPTWYSAAPVMHHSILAMARSNPLIGTALQLRAIRSTSSALPPQLLGLLEHHLSAPVVEAYALSEAPGQIASNPLDGPRKAGTVGRPQRTEIALLTATGQVTQAPGRSGEILVRGANVMSGYLGVPDSEQPFLDGWLRTGDQGAFDDDGYLIISGRLIDVISRGAEKFPPAEVEAVLAGHPAVAEVAVFGQPHPTLGEEASAAVVLRAGSSATERELIAFAAEQLAGYKVPVRIEFCPELPRSAAGKIMRGTLRELTARSTRRPSYRMGPPR